MLFFIYLLIWYGLFESKIVSFSSSYAVFYLYLSGSKGTEVGDGVETEVGGTVAGEENIVNSNAIMTGTGTGDMEVDTSQALQTPTRDTTPITIGHVMTVTDLCFHTYCQYLWCYQCIAVFGNMHLFSCLYF